MIGRRLFAILMLMALSDQVLSQDAKENVLLRFDGGFSRMQFRLYGQLLPQHGQMLRYPSSDTWDLWTNPASLITFRSPYVSLGIQPGIGIDPARYTDVSGRIRSRVNNNTANYRVPETEIVYPEVAVDVGAPGGLYGIQVAYPVKLRGKRTTFSLELGQPFQMDADFANDALDILVRTIKSLGDRTQTVNMRVSAGLQGRLWIHSTRYSLGLARLLGPNLAAGVTFGQIWLRTGLHFRAKIDGVMETAGTEYAFNDPYDPRIDFSAGETNRLDQRADVDFSGSGWHARFGFLFRPDRDWTVGCTYVRQPDLHIRGHMVIEQYKIPALNVDALLSNNPDVDLVDATKLELAKPSLTAPVNNKTSDHMTVYLPSRLEVQGSFQKGRFAAVVTAAQYVGKFGFAFIDDAYYAEPGMDFTLKLQYGIVHIAFGTLNGQLVEVENGKERSRKPFRLPHFEFRVSSFLLYRYHVDSFLFMAPFPGVGLRVGVFL
jgi:hypothetical protein